MTVESAPWSYSVAIEEPYLRSRSGVPEGAKVSILSSKETLTGLNPASARSLGEALLEAADRAERVNAATLPFLHQFTEALAPFRAEEDAT